METGLTGRTAIVTGAAGGIGLACARGLAAEGARVALSDLDPGATEAAAASVDGSLAVAADVTSPDDCRRLVEEAAGRFASVDVLVACAGIFHATRLDELEAEEWDRILAVNLKGTFLPAQAALREMIPHGWGRIVTIASLAGQVGGLASGAAYAASKAGIVGLTKSIARFGGPHGVTANTVNPGVIDTPMIAAWPAESRERTLAATPLGRIGTAEEVASVVVWLCSDGAGFVTGAQVDINGGIHMD